jgi:hypothetical protein
MIPLLHFSHGINISSHVELLISCVTFCNHLLAKEEVRFLNGTTQTIQGIVCRLPDPLSIVELTMKWECSTL